MSAVYHSSDDQHAVSFRWSIIGFHDVFSLVMSGKLWGALTKNLTVMSNEHHEISIQLSLGYLFSRFFLLTVNETSKISMNDPLVTCGFPSLNPRNHFHIMTSSWWQATWVWCYGRFVSVWMEIMIMMTSSYGNIFRVTGPLWGESTCHRWIPLTKVSEPQLWCFLSSVPEQTVEQTIEMLVIWEVIGLIMMSLQWFHEVWIWHIGNWIIINTWWCHDVETFSSLLSLCEGYHLWISLIEGQYCGALILIVVFKYDKAVNSWVSSDLKCHDVHVTPLQ